MINRWQGNTGRVQRFPERSDRLPEKPVPKPGFGEIHAPHKPAPAPMPSRQRGLFSGLESLKKLIPGKTEDLETEDIILLLILYLMYRESGDSELLMIMGAMFLL